jgi:hypothetical protein
VKFDVNDLKLKTNNPKKYFEDRGAGAAYTQATYVFRQLYSAARAFALPGYAPQPGFSNQRKTSVAVCMRSCYSAQLIV